MIRFAVLVSLVLLGCSTPPRERFYTLDAPEPPVAAPQAASLAVWPVSVPEMVDRPQLVVRTSANEVMIAEQARWAEPLKSAIGRVVAANLAANLGMRLAGPARNADADYRVVLDILRFDSGPDQGVLIDAAWTVIGPKTARRTGRSVVREKTATKYYDALAAAHSAALAAISKDIAAAIREQK
jgi:uncharacterized lipoprotein YmbA